jgi:hypothetical protein
MLEVGKSVAKRWTKHSRPTTRAPSYNTTQLTKADFETVFGDDFEIEENTPFSTFNIKGKSDQCLFLRDLHGVLHIVKLQKCVISGKELLGKLIRLAEKFHKALIVDEDTSGVFFDFDSKQFGEETYQLRFNFVLAIMYIKSYGYTWYNSLGFLNDDFEQNRIYFTKKFQNEFEENRKKIAEIKKITKKGKNMTKDEYDTLKRYEKFFGYSEFFNNSELQSHFRKMTDQLRYQKIVLGGAKKKNRKTMKGRKYQRRL